MDFQTIPGTQTTPPAAAKNTAKTSALSLADFDGFLKLFLVQLKYQDPLSPASQDEFLAQTAQFSSVEQLISLNQKMTDFATASRASAASLIGRRVEGTVTDDKGVATKVDGLVAQVDYGDSGNLVLGLQDGTSLPFANISAISQA